MIIDDKIPSIDILSIDADDDNENYLAFDEFLQEDTKRKMNKSAAVIDEWGELLLKEIDKKKKMEKLRIKKLIPYILKHSDGKYDEEELIKYTFKDVQDIYNEIKKENESFFIKFFHFLFNIS